MPSSIASTRCTSGTFVIAAYHGLLYVGELHVSGAVAAVVVSLSPVLTAVFESVNDGRCQILSDGGKLRILRNTHDERDIDYRLTRMFAGHHLKSFVNDGNSIGTIEWTRIGRSIKNVITKRGCHRSPQRR